MKNLRLFNIALLLVAVLLVPASHAQDSGDARVDSLVSISLIDDTQLEGIVIQETETHVFVETLAGLEVKVPRASIVAIEKHHAGAFFLPDPNYSRLMFAPTGRPLRRGDRYFFNHYVFFPGMAYGLTDHFTMFGGVSFIPGLGLDDQVLSVAPSLVSMLATRLPFPRVCSICMSPAIMEVWPLWSGPKAPPTRASPVASA